jgi:2-phosphoglycerate kinase
MLINQSHMPSEMLALRERLQHVYWLGGGSGGGKSTIARRIAADHGLKVYATDDVMSDHARRAADEDAPYLSQFKSMDMDERWAKRSPETMLDTFHWFRGEGFNLIIEDLLKLPSETGVIAEGFRLLPALVKPLVADPRHVVWLLPTPEFRLAAFASRGTTWDIPDKTSNPARAYRNLLERDRMFTERLREETKRLGLPAIEVDTSISEDELTELVTRSFGL